MSFNHILRGRVSLTTAKEEAEKAFAFKLSNLVEMENL